MTEFERKFNELDKEFEARYTEAKAYVDAGKKTFENVECHKATKILDDEFNIPLPINNNCIPDSTFQQTVNNNDLLFQQHVSENNMQQFMQPTAADVGAATHQQMFMGI